MFRSVLIPVDLSPASARVVQRAGLLPVTPGGALTLVHVVPHALPRSFRLRAEGDARKVVAKLAGALSRHLPDGVAVRWVVKTGAAAVEIAGEGVRRRADLIVLGRGSGRMLRDVFLGSTAERVVRRARIPVLVVRLPANGPYRRPLLALDEDQAAREVLDATLRLLPSPRPELAMVHAYTIPYYGVMHRGLSMKRAREIRREFRQRALHQMTQLQDAGRTGDPTDEVLRWETHVRHGAARHVIPQTVKRTRADLLALGTHGYTGLAHAFLGTVAGDVLREVGCDVLVAPPATGGNSGRRNTAARRPAVRRRAT